jgi:hypothetical protein
MANETPFYTKTSEGRYLQVVTLADREGDLLNITNNGLDVSMQDQHTPSVIAKFNKVTNSTTLASAVSIGDTQATLTSTTGVSVGTYLIFFNPESVRFMTATVISVLSSPTFDIDTPFDFAFPEGTYVDVSTTNLAVNGSVTPQVFGLRGVGTPPGIDLTVDITRLIFSCITTSAVDLSKFANFAVLTKGIVCRVRNGTYENVFNLKSNREIAGIMYDWTPFASTNPQQGVDGFVSRLTFAGANKIGVTKRLALGEDLQIIIQDDLATAQGGETITVFEIIAEGHIVE